MSNKTVLIVDDDSAFLDALAKRCRSLGLTVHTATDGLKALAMVLKEPPDLLVLDINMPAGNGLGVAERLVEDTTIPPLPVVFCTGRSDPETIERCKALGAHYLLKDSTLWPQLKSIICRSLGIGDAPDAAAEAPARPPRVLFVDDDADMRRVLQVRLRACGIDVETAATAMQGLWMAVSRTPDVVITDYWMPEGSGEYLLGRLRAVPVLRDIPIILLTGAAGGARRDFALERRFLGEHRVSAFLGKPLDFNALIEALSRHIRIDSDVWRQAAALSRR